MLKKIKDLRQSEKDYSSVHLKKSPQRDVFLIFLNIFSNFTTQNKKQGKNPENILIFSGWTQLITDAVNGQWYLKNVYTAHIQEPRLMVVQVK